MYFTLSLYYLHYLHYLGELHYHARSFSNPLTSFNKFRLVVSKGPLIFAVDFRKLLIIKQLNKIIMKNQQLLIKKLNSLLILTQ